MLLRWRKTLGGFDGGVQVAATPSESKQTADALPDLVVDRPYGLDALPGGVVEVPVLVALARKDRAGVAATHGDHDVGGLHDLFGPRLGYSLAISMPTSIAATVAGLTSMPGSEPPDHAMACFPARWLNQPRAIWGSTGVVHAEEQHSGTPPLDLPSTLPAR